MNQDFIEIYPNLVVQDQCDIIIKRIDEILDTRVTPYMQKHVVGDQRVDQSLFAEYDYPEAAEIINNALSTAIDLYLEKYNIINTRDTRILMPYSTYSVKLQRTHPGGGFHSWHCENSGNNDTDRILAWTVYLNTFEGEAETEFLQHGRRLNPVAGSIAIWPAYWTHMHRGNPPYSKSKYIATGWFQFTGEKYIKNPLSGVE